MRLIAEGCLHALAAAHVRLSDRPEADVLGDELGVRRLQRIGGQIIDRSHAQPVRLGGRILQVAVGQVTGEVVLLTALYECEFGAISIVVAREIGLVNLIGLVGLVNVFLERERERELGRPRKLS